MQNAPSQNADDSTAASRLASNSVPESSDDFFETPEFLMRSLLIGGVLLVCLAGWLAYVFTRTRIGPNTYSGSPDEIRDMALIIRSFGFMAFAAGLVERIIIAISKLKA